MLDAVEVGGQSAMQVENKVIFINNNALHGEFFAQLLELADKPVEVGVIEKRGALQLVAASVAQGHAHALEFLSGR